jgi:hypothetical protein
MADQSTFSRFQKKQLIFIANKLIENGFEWDNITHDYENIYDDNEKILSGVASYFNESVVEEDVQFFIKFLEINSGLLTRIIKNNDKSMIEHLIIPQSKDYLVEYTVSGSCTFEEEYETRFSCYDKDWVIDSLYLQRNNGNWDVYSGTLKNTEYDNWETNDFEIDKIKDVPNNVKESRNPKRLLENTEKLIPKLDRDTLVKLKYLIDKELRGL